MDMRCRICMISGILIIREYLIAYGKPESRIKEVIML